MQIHFRVPPTNEGVALVQLTYALRRRLAPELAELVPILFKSAAAPCGNAPSLFALGLDAGSTSVRPCCRTVAFQSVAQRRASSGIVMVAGPAAKAARWHRLL